jgi:hypothetical protein
LVNLQYDTFDGDELAISNFILEQFKTLFATIKRLVGEDNFKIIFEEAAKSS